MLIPNTTKLTLNMKNCRLRCVADTSQMGTLGTEVSSHVANVSRPEARRILERVQRKLVVRCRVYCSESRCKVSLRRQLDLRGPPQAQEAVTPCCCGPWLCGGLAGAARLAATPLGQRRRCAAQAKEVSLRPCESVAPAGACYPATAGTWQTMLCQKAGLRATADGDAAAPAHLLTAEESGGSGRQATNVQT